MWTTRCKLVSTAGRNDWSSLIHSQMKGGLLSAGQSRGPSTLLIWCQLLLPSHTCSMQSVILVVCSVVPPDHGQQAESVWLGQLWTCFMFSSWKAEQLEGLSMWESESRLCLVHEICGNHLGLKYNRNTRLLRTQSPWASWSSITPSALQSLGTVSRRPKYVSYVSHSPGKTARRSMKTISREWSSPFLRWG